MQEVILYIQPQVRTGTTQDYVRADLMETELITLTQVIQDVKEIDKIFTDYSRTFNLPASKKNNILFKRWYNPDIVGFDNQIMANARIELNHLPFKEGKIRLESVTMKHGQPSLYKVTFFGNTVTINDLIGEDKLNNLVWLNNFNFEASNSNIKDGIENGINKTVDGVTYTDAIIYPLISHSQSYIYDETGNQDNGLNISNHQNATNIKKRGVFPEDLKPAITAKIIIKAIEKKYGITFKSGGFFDSAAMTSLYMWLHREKGNVVSEGFKLVDDQAFTCVSTDVARCNYFDGETNVYFNTSKGTYSFYYTASYGQNRAESFQFVAQITPTTSSIYSYDFINVLDGTVYRSINNVTGTTVAGIDFGDPVNASGYIDVDLNQTIEVGVRVRSNISITFGVFISPKHRVYLTGGTTQTETSAQYQSDSTTIPISSDLNITSQIPDIKVIDFMKALFKMHNLTSFVNFNGDVEVKTLDSFYSSGDTLDLTNYVKTDEHSVGSTVPFSEVDFEYSEPKSILAQQFLNSNNKKYGELNFISDSTKGSKYEIKIPFEHMIFERLQDRTSNDLTTIQIGSFLDEDLNPSIGAPLLFYAIYQQSGNEVHFIYNTRPSVYGALADNNANVNDVFNLTNYWIPSVNNELGTSSTAPTYNLNFGSEINTYTLIDYSGINNSLFQLYYQNYITRVFNKRTRLFNYKAILPLNILLKLSLDDTIIIQERAFTINKMTTKLQSGETEFELLNEPT